MVTRISSLPRRDWREDATAVGELTEALRTPAGTQRLRPIQAVAIREAMAGGLVLNARVGAGKTLVAALLCTLYADLHPIMIVPGGHSDKTDREIAEYRKHWKIAHALQIVTYSDIARDVDERLLSTYAPGAIICDEVDKLRRVTSSGTAKRIAKYMAEHPDTLFFGMSGTIFKQGLKDFAHLLNWALKDRAPVPRLPVEIDAWHKGLKGEQGSWPKMQAQLECTGDVVEAFRDRLFHTPGCIISTDQFTGVPLTLETVTFDAGTQDALRALEATGETPDGWDTSGTGGDADTGPGSTWAAERQLALGFYYRPDPRPPVPWTQARKGYFRLVRRMLDGHFNTELQVRRWAEKEQHPIWLKWKAMEPTFTPTFVPEWLSDRALQYCQQWGQAGGIIWTDHRAFASRLASASGWRWFAGGGTDSTGLAIEACKDRTIIASRQANGVGRNLQNWHRGLITATPANGADFEQLLGRQHREGQQHPVEMSILLGCATHARDLGNVVDLSEEESKQLMRANKVLHCAWR